MRTAYMGNGEVIVYAMHHPKIKGKLIVFSKSKKRLPLLSLKEYAENPIPLNEVGKGLFQIYFPDKATLKRLIDHLTNVYEKWED